MRRLLSFLFTVLLGFSLFAQNTLTGKVTDSKGVPLAGVNVYIEKSKQLQQTNQSGVFRFSGLEKDQYVLRFSYTGFQTLHYNVPIGKECVVVLQPLDNLIREVTVTSVRAEDKTPVAYTNMNKEAIAKNNLGQDIPYLLSQTPSLVVSSDAGTGIGYTGFRIRGTDAARINVTINGVPFNDADEQGAYWVDLPDFASSVENMQIQRGVGTSTNGAASFGANINLQTENFAPSPTAEVSVSGGSFSTLKTTVKAGTGLMNGHWAIDTRLSSVRSGGYIDRGWVHMKSYFVQAGYYGEKNSVKLITFGGNEQTYHAWDGVPKDSLQTHRTYNPCGYMGTDANGKAMYYKNQTDNYLQTHYQLVGTHQLSSAFTLSEALHYTRGDGYYEEYKQNQSLYKYGLNSFVMASSVVSKSDLVRQKKMGNDFAGAVFSLNFKHDNFQALLSGGSNCYMGDHWGEVTWVKNYVGANMPGKEYYRSDVKKRDSNVSFKVNYEFADKLTLYADIQYRQVNYQLNGTNDEWDSSIGGMQKLDVGKHFQFYNPKTGVYYKPDLYNDLYMSFAVAHREPTRTNYTDGSASTWPTHETLYDWETGYRFHRTNVSVGTNVYFMKYYNQLILTGKINEIGEALTENIADSYRAGVEFVGELTITKWLRWNANLTISKNEIRNFKEYVDLYDADWNSAGQKEIVYSKTPIAFSPNVTGNSVFTFKISNLECGLQSQYVGKQYIDNTGSNDRSLDAYLINHVRVNYKLPVKAVEAVNILLQVNNVLNKKYISNAWTYSYMQGDDSGYTRYNDFGFYPQAGINFLAGINVKF